jgi:hypothetical protein
MPKNLRFLSFFLMAILAFAQAAKAHIGSPEVVMQGQAGSYVMLVSVLPPDVIPGVAKITVYTQNEPITKLTATAMFYRSGPKGTAPPDVLKPVAGKPGQYSGELWLMSTGSTGIQLKAEGKFGKGELVVPVVAVSSAIRSLPPGTGWMLAGLALFLFILLTTIFGSSVSDAMRKVGAPTTGEIRRKRWTGALVGALITGALLYGGHAWWQSWADDYQKYMYKPMQAKTVVRQKDGVSQLEFAIDTTGKRASGISFIIPDHGKLMHLFLLRYPAMDAFTHLHPQRSDSVRFTSILPPLPKGKYLVFADVVYLSGFTETIKDTLIIEADIPPTPTRVDRDDAYAFALPANLVDNAQIANSADSNMIVCGVPGTGLRLSDGSTMVWEGMTNAPLKAGVIQNMQFAVFTPEKQPATLDAYLGMGGHAAVMRNDGNVYVHLHPVGTFTPASEGRLKSRLTDERTLASNPPDSKSFRDSIDQVVSALANMSATDRDNKLMEGVDMVGMTMDSTGRMLHPNMVSFPYSFPSAGQYRIWVQVKHKGKVLTGAFDKLVE